MKKLLYVLVAALCCTSIQAQTLNEGFEGNQFPPEGWTTANTSTYSYWYQTTKEGTKCAYTPGSYATECWLITPQLKPAAGEKLTFKARVKEYTSQGKLQVEVSTTGRETSSFSVVETYFTSSTKGDEAHRIWKSDWREFTVDLSAYTGQRIYITFHQTGEAEGIYLDDVKGVTLAGSETCEAPTALQLNAIQSTSATIAWQGSAAEYQYLVLTEGETLDWDKAKRIAAKTVTLTELEENTVYAFYVRAYCSADEQSMAPKLTVKTPCEAEAIPWVETFTRDATGDVAPECWTVASERPQVWVVAEKTYDEEGNAQTIYGQAHLYASGGGASTAQVFAMPTFNAPLNTLEVAFDYKTSMVDANYGVLEIGYMTNPAEAGTFVSLQTLPQTLTYSRVTIPLNAVPNDVSFVAFRFAGGTSDFSGASLDNFVVAEIGKSGEIDPTQDDGPDDAIWAQTYCSAQFTWYAYNDEAFLIGLFDADAKQLIAGIAVTAEECDRFAYEDKQTGEFSGFSEDDDYEHHFYCSTKWILNIDESGLQKGDSWSKCVINIGTAASPLLGLKEGPYQVQVYGLDPLTYTKGDKLATIPFTLVEKKVTNLAVAVADDHKTATLTWEAPELGTGERLYVSVRSGETVAYDNFETSDKPASPFSVNVEDSKSYEARVQIIDRNKNPLGAETTVSFTVGVNPYEPKNAHAEVFSGDNVTFSWEAETEADRYVITLYCEGEYYSSLTVIGKTKTTTMPKDGTWSWTVQAFNEGANGNYFEASRAITGNDFVAKTADIPDDAVVLNIWGFDAAYLDEASGYYQEGKFGWYLTFATGDEDGSGYPLVSFLLYTAKEYAISGAYNVARGNLDLESCYLNTTGKQADAIWATDAEIRLQFDGFDEDYFEQGYRYGYYTGQFRLVGNDGKTYVGKFMELFCNSYNFSSMATGTFDHKGMWDEEGEEPPHQGIDNTEVNATPAHKYLRDGQLFILRDGKTYNAQGIRVQ